MTHRWHGGSGGGQAEQARMGPDTQAAQRTLAGQLRRPRPGAAHGAAHLHREDGRRAVAVRRAPADRARTSGPRRQHGGSSRRPRASPWGSTPPPGWSSDRLKHRTRAHYASLLANHITPRLGGWTLRNLTPAAVRAWYSVPGPGPPDRQQPRLRAAARHLRHRGGRRAAGREPVSDQAGDEHRRASASR